VTQDPNHQPTLQALFDYYKAHDNPKMADSIGASWPGCKADRMTHGAPPGVYLACGKDETARHLPAG